MGPTARACDEERSASLRASVGNIGVESPLVSRLIDCAVTALFVFGIYLGVMAWDCGGLLGARRRCGGYGMPAHLPLASVPIALTVAAFIDAALGGMSALARGKRRELAVSPLTPRLCAIMAIAFLWTCTAHLPSMCSTALRDLAAPGGEDAGMASTFDTLTAATYADEKHLARRSPLNPLNPPPSSLLTESARYPHNSSSGGQSGNEEALEDGALRSGVGRQGDILGGVDPALSHSWFSTWVRACRKIFHGQVKQ